MPRHCVRWRLALLMAGGFVLALAGSLAACGGSSGDDPPPVAPAEQPAAAATTPSAETVPPSAATPELPVAPVEPPTEGETAPIATATPESPAASAETPVLDPSTPPAGAPEIAATSTFRYDTYDLSGTVGEPGHYAFLADPNDPTSAVTTYEELRDGTTTALLIHTHDVHGVSQAGIYDAVAPGDLFEWSQAYDCFVRYQVMEVKPDPGSPEPRALLAVEWMTYAFAGCSGPIAAGTAATFEWGDLPNLGHPRVTTPIRHGPFQLMPDRWTGSVELGARHELPEGTANLHSSAEIRTADPSEVGQRPYWRDPKPATVVYFQAVTIEPEEAAYGHCQLWHRRSLRAFTICAYPLGPFGASPWEDSQAVHHETRVIAGRPALVEYNSPDSNYPLSIRLWVYDAVTESFYLVRTSGGILRVVSVVSGGTLRAHADTASAIARGLFESPPRTPPPHPGVALIEPAPGAFEQRTFATGERIDWTHGIFVLDPETGATEGYRAPEAEGDLSYNYYASRPGGWISVKAEIGTEWFRLLLHRATGQSWRWPSGLLRLAATSSEHLLFEERTRSGDVLSTGRFTIVNRAMEAVGHFSIDVDGLGVAAVFSPDGQTIALNGRRDTIYLVPVATAQPAVLFKAEATDDQAKVWLDRRRYEGPDIRVFAYYETASGDQRREQHDFSWEGQPLPVPGAACHAPAAAGFYEQPKISPDGRYAAWLVGGHVVLDHYGPVIREDPWPSVVIADAATCAPLFRVRSAQTHELLWDADWLSNSAGFVIRVHDGYQIVRVHPTPHLVRLPGKGARPANLASGGSGVWDGWEEGPEPAPTGDGRYFGYGPSVYDAVEDRWVGPELDDPNPSWWWGDSHRERWFGLINESHGGNEWLLLPPTIEFPPFPDVIAFRVAGTGSCLRLRAAPGQESETRDCLPDGARLVLTAPAETPPYLVRDPGAPPSQPHPAVALWYPGDDPRMTWVHIRTEDGAEGWVSHDYLEHD
ncbi:MAG: hypothetical protein OXG19_03485 [Chloroflexi bacterium]|nr:hypothetical protein [Chloroflexota bacterium]